MYFGQPQVPSDFTSNIQPSNFNDGDGGAVWFTSSAADLTSNPPDFGNANSGSIYRNGFQSPGAINSSTTVNVCPNSTNYGASFVNQTKGTGLTQGTFYVVVQGINTYIPMLGISSNVFVRWAIQYRANSSGSWAYLADLNNNTISGVDAGGSYDYSGVNTRGMTSNSGNFLSIDQAANSQDFFARGTKVFAFDTVGEYRIVYGNISSDFGEFQLGVNCNIAGQQNLSVNGRLQIGDFYYPGFDWWGDQDGVYEYRIASSNTCGVNFGTGTAYYAAEPFAKYVTQLYTNTSLLTPASVNGTARFRRMETRGSSAVSNPEQTQDGAYTATFSSGLRTSGSTPCTF